MDNWLEAYTTSVEQDKECCDRTIRQFFFAIQPKAAKIRSEQRLVELHPIEDLIR